MNSTLSSTDRERLGQSLGLSDGQTPYPWQEQLLARMREGHIPPFLDIPTGLGKTSVMAIWLIARAGGSPLPRRLVYVVDRRAVVDQATQEAIQLRAMVDGNPSLREGLGLPPGRSLPISTLRGQHIDNREWLENPAIPAIIVGTVDMIGSRLLFQGYGCSRKMRPYHAGLLGADTLFVLDESHLVPPFERLLADVAHIASSRRDAEQRTRDVVPPLRVLTLSATGRRQDDDGFRLTEDDQAHPELRKRLTAPKHLSIRELRPNEDIPSALASEAWEVQRAATTPRRSLIFCDRRKDAEKVKAWLDKRIREAKRNEGYQAQTELFVGGRRVREREDAARRLAELGFLPGGAATPSTPVFLIATSAAEVGVDLDADDAVMDLVAWERMIQRLGRVNRRGRVTATVRVILPDTQKRSDEEVERQGAVVEILRSLPPLSESNLVDASPASLLSIRADTDQQERLRRGTTPAPLHPCLSDAVLESWSLTSLRQHTGRPAVQPWLRGWVDDPPRTVVVWRAQLPVDARGAPASRTQIARFFEAAPPHTSEFLEIETSRALSWLIARTKAAKAIAPEASSASLRDDELAALTLLPDGRPGAIWCAKDLVSPADKRERDSWKKDLRSHLEGATLVVDSRLGGIESGLLSERSSSTPRTADDGEPWLATETDDTAEAAPVIRFRVRRVATGETSSSPWRERLRLPLATSEDEDTESWILVEKWRHDGTTEEDRSTSRPQLLDEHLTWTENRAQALAQRLGLSAEYQEMLAVAARLHDEGKRADRWQRAFNAPDDGVYAKTRGPIRLSLLDGYRHELGSVLRAETSERFKTLPHPMKELALHIIAAHHGHARPLLPIDSCDDAPPSALEELQQDVARRFAYLQQAWGVWGLAWWESLLRAADQQASRDNDALDTSLSQGGRG